ncbi:MAG: SDR family oxidoreductase [Myxococcales bacterium]
MNRLKGKVAVVTGGNSGIGLAIAQRFASEGADVTISGRRRAELDAAARAMGPRVSGVLGDVAKNEDLDRLFDEVKRRSDHIDVLVANAGVGELAPLSAITEEHYRKTFDVNVKGTLFTVQKALPLMRDGGSIIVLGSTAGVKGSAAFSVYSATKAAIRNLVRSWIIELKGRNIRVNVLAPGGTLTPGLQGLADEQSFKAFSQALVESTPLGRLAKPEEIASAALFLASDESSFVHGAELFVDGGLAQY